jgi:hypothetical protein
MGSFHRKIDSLKVTTCQIPTENRETDSVIHNL